MTAIEVAPGSLDRVPGVTSVTVDAGQWSGVTALDMHLPNLLLVLPTFVLGILGLFPVGLLVASLAGPGGQLPDHRRTGRPLLPLGLTLADP